MSARLRQCLTTVALAAPPILFFKDNFYSLCRVKGSSMEPALYHGDIILVRKSDVFPKAMWQRYLSASVPDTVEEEEEHQNAVRVMALDASAGRPIGEWWWGYTFLKPPMIHQLGTIIVFLAPDAAKYPSSEYRVKRVVGLGGQLCRASDDYHNIKKVPEFSLWVEGDNRDSDTERSVDSLVYGPVCKNTVVGVAERIVWPPSRWGAIPCVTPPVPRAWWQY
ncbi:hypothetical protein ACHAXT_012894 [Thalassiosira profunda]